jgi:hypothetical protein
MFNWFKKLFTSPKPPPVQTPPPSYNKPRKEPAVKRQPFQASTRPSYAKDSAELPVTPLALDQLSPLSPHRNSIWDHSPTSVQHDDVYQSPSNGDGDDSLRSTHATPHVNTSTSHSSSWDSGHSHSSHDTSHSHCDTSSSSSYDGGTSSSSFDSGGGSFDGGSSGGSFDGGSSGGSFD